MTDGSNAETVTIIGAGIGGLYLVAELGIAGFKLRLHDIDDSRLSEIQARGGVDVEGERGGFAAVERPPTNLPSAVESAARVFPPVTTMITPAPSRRETARNRA